MGDEADADGIAGDRDEPYPAGTQAENPNADSARADPFDVPVVVAVPVLPHRDVLEGGRLQNGNAHRLSEDTDMARSVDVMLCPNGFTLDLQPQHAVALSLDLCNFDPLAHFAAEFG